MAYITFEDMKHCIPEGATHYQNETKEFSFAWFNVDEDKCYVDGQWWPYSLDGYPMDEIKPIPPTIKTDSSEEREAIDMMDTTTKQIESLEKGDLVEWKNGDYCIYNENEYMYVGKFDCKWSSEDDTDRCVIVNPTLRPAMICAHEKYLSKPESPEQKAERERDGRIHAMVDDFNEQDIDYNYRGQVVKVCAALYDAGYRKAK